MTNLSQLRRQDASPSLVLIIVCAGVILASLDLFIVNVALPSMARDLHEPNLSTMSWVLNAYAIVYAALLVLVGRLSEGRSRQNGFLLGALIFTVASVVILTKSHVAAPVAPGGVGGMGGFLLTVGTSFGYAAGWTRLQWRAMSTRRATQTLSCAST